MLKIAFLIIVITLVVVALAIWFVPKNKEFVTKQLDGTSSCTPETCDAIIECGPGSDPNGGCVPVYTGWEWKDPTLKSKYKQVTAEEAKACAEKFILENKSKFTLEYADWQNQQLYVTGTEKLMAQDIYVGPIDEKDTYFWRVYNGVDLKVGAQTCKVYPVKHQFRSAEPHSS